MKDYTTNVGNDLAESIYIHDFIFDRLCYIHDKKELHLCTFDLLAVPVEIHFIDVLAITMTSCEFWGGSPHIFDFECLPPERQTLLPALLSEMKTLYEDIYQPRHKDYHEVLITLTSGDRITIVCQAVTEHKGHTENSEDGQCENKEHENTGDGSVC